MNKQRPRILMVEDSASLAAVYQAYLQDDPYRVLTADSLGRARDALGSFQPDIVLLDISMPGMDGMSLARTLQRGGVQPAIIFCTAYQNQALAALLFL